LSPNKTINNKNYKMLASTIQFSNNKQTPNNPQEHNLVNHLASSAATPPHTHVAEAPEPNNVPPPPTRTPPTPVPHPTRRQY